MVTNEKYEDKRKRTIAKKKNAKLYPIYKMVSWDLLFFYSIQYLFYTIVKGVTPGEILRIDALYPIFIILLQMPVIIIGEALGRRKSIILGNSVLILYILALLWIPGSVSIIVSNFIFAFGYSLKTMQETSLLYDSTATRGGDGIFGKINEKGGIGYYVLDGIASLLAGYLFVMNSYLPLYICLAFIIISTILSFKFEDIYTNNFKKASMKEMWKDYKEDMKGSVKSIIQSKRLRAMILFFAVFEGILYIAGTYRGSLLTQIGVTEESFSMIVAILTLVGGLSVAMQEKLQKKFKNRTLSFLGFSFIISMIIIGMVTINTTNISIIPIILLMYVIQYISRSNYYILQEKYAKNFTTPKNRSRISCTIDTVTNLTIAVVSFVAGMLLDTIPISYAFLLSGLAFLAILIVTLEYMKKRVGLKPEEYSVEDINI